MLPPRDAVADTGSMQPIPEAVTWAQRADEWARQPPGEPGAGTDLQPSRWSDVAPTGRTTTHLPDGVGWRTETAEWRSTAEMSRWRQTTEWRSTSGTHGWRSTTEAWRTGDAADPAAPPGPERPAISGTAWTTPGSGDPEAPPHPAGWSPAAPPSGAPWTPPAGPPAGDPPWSPDTPAAPPPSTPGPPAWQQPAADTPTWQQPAVDPSAWRSPAPDPPPWQRPADPPSWQQPAAPAAPGPPPWSPPPADAWPGDEPTRSLGADGGWRTPSGADPAVPPWRDPGVTPPVWTGTPAAAPSWTAPDDRSGGRHTAPDDTPSWRRGPDTDTGRHYVREDDRARWRESAGWAAGLDEPTRRVGRRRAAEPDEPTAGGSGWAVRSPADDWAGHTDTGDLPSYRDPDDRTDGGWTDRDAADRTGAIRPDRDAGDRTGGARADRGAAPRRAAPDPPDAGPPADGPPVDEPPSVARRRRTGTPPRRRDWEPVAGSWPDEDVERWPSLGGGPARRRSRADDGGRGGTPPDDEWVTERIDPDRDRGAGRAAWSAGADGDAAPRGRRRATDPGGDEAPRGRRATADDRPRGAGTAGYDDDRGAWGRRAADDDRPPDDRPRRRAAGDPDGYADPAGDGPRRRRPAWQDDLAGTAAAPPADRPARGRRDAGDDWRDDLVAPADEPPRRRAPDPDARPRRADLLAPADDRTDAWDDAPDGRYPGRDSGRRTGADGPPDRRPAWRDDLAADAAPPGDPPPRRPAWRDDLVEPDRGPRRDGPPGPDRDGRRPGWRDDLVDPNGDPRREGPPGPDRDGRRPGWRDDLVPPGGDPSGPDRRPAWRDDLTAGADPVDGPGPAGGGPRRDDRPARRGGDWRADLVGDGGRPVNGYRAVGSASPDDPRRGPADGDPSADWRRDLVDPDDDPNRGLRRDGRVVFDEPDPPDAGPAGDGLYRTQGGGTDGWRRELQAELGGTGAGPADGPPGGPGTARYRSGSGDWRRDLDGPGPRDGFGGADPGPPRAQGAGFDPAPFRSPDVGTASATALTAPPGTVRQAPGREQLLVASDSAANLLDAPETSWSRGAVAVGTGSYERRATGSIPALVAPQGDLLEPDDDEEYEEATGGPLAAVGYTVVWYGVPVVLFGLYMLFAGGDQRRPALSTLAGAAPQFGLSLALSMLVAVGLRWISGSWKSASVGLAAAVLGGGIATVLASAITGQSLS